MLTAFLLTQVACVFPPEDFEYAYATWCDTARSEVVDCVYDGDTFYLGGCGGDSEEDFRLLGIQAPELSTDNDEEPQCYGTEATELLEELVLGERVRLEFDVECEGVFGRTLAWVFLEDPSPAVISTIEQIEGFDEEIDTTDTTADDRNDLDEILINEVMVRAGYATLYEGEVANNVRYSSRLEDALEQAEDQSRGLWGECD